MPSKWAHHCNPGDVYRGASEISKTPVFNAIFQSVTCPQSPILLHLGSGFDQATGWCLLMLSCFGPAAGSGPHLLHNIFRETH